MGMMKKFAADYLNLTITIFSITLISMGVGFSYGWAHGMIAGGAALFFDQVVGAVLDKTR